jgi:hypothetical protein
MDVRKAGGTKIGKPWRAGKMGDTGLSYGSAGRTPGKPETTRLGSRVGNTRGDHTESRHIKIQVKESDKGHKRSLVRPVHQGASKSQQKLTPKAKGPIKFSFGTL